MRFRRSYVFVLATFPSPLSNFQFEARLKGLDRGQWSFSAVIMRLRPVGPAAFLGGHEERRQLMKQTSGSAGFSAVTMRKTSCAMRFFLGPNEQTSKRWSLMKYVTSNHFKLVSLRFEGTKLLLFLFQRQSRHVLGQLVAWDRGLLVRSLILLGSHQQGSREMRRMELMLKWQLTKLLTMSPPDW